jgi:hypothetical protein
MRRIVYSCGHACLEAAYRHGGQGWEVHPNHYCATMKGGQLCSDNSKDYSHADNPRKLGASCPDCVAAIESKTRSGKRYGKKDPSMIK